MCSPENSPDDEKYNAAFEIQYEMNLKSALKVKQEFLNAADETLLNVAKQKKEMLLRNGHQHKMQKNGRSKVDQQRRNKKTFLKNKNASEITYVGIHHRQTDHVQFMKERENREPLDEKYFSLAFQYFR